MSQIPEMFSDGVIIGDRSMRLINLVTLVNLREVFIPKTIWDECYMRKNLFVSKMYNII